MKCPCCGESMEHGYTDSQGNMPVFKSLNRIYFTSDSLAYKKHSLPYSDKRDSWYCKKCEKIIVLYDTK